MWLKEKINLGAGDLAMAYINPIATGLVFAVGMKRLSELLPCHMLYHKAPVARTHPKKALSEAVYYLVINK